MRKICLFLTALLLIGQISVFAATDAPVVLTYTAAFSKEQGKNNWYFYEYGKTDAELVWNGANNNWKSATSTFPIYADGEMTPDNTKAVGFRFFAPEKGMIRLKGSVIQPYSTSTSGNGVNVSIWKGSTELWKGYLKFSADVSYDLQTSIRLGEYIDFKIDANGNNGYDWTRWYPTVEYLGTAFAEDRTDKYYQVKDGEKIELSYDVDKEVYVAEDGLAMIGDLNVMPTDKYSVMKSVEVKKVGRYRVLCNLETGDIRSNGVIVKVYKNGRMFWQQLCVDDATSVIDVRAYCVVGDIIDVEVLVNEFGGYNNYDWTCDIGEYVGTVENLSSTSVGENYYVTDEFLLGSMIGATQGANGVKVYSIRKDVWHPMAYNSAKGYWETTVEISGANAGGYVSKKAVNPGANTDSVIEWTVSKPGIIKLSGNVSAIASNDGVVVDVYKNDKLIWSNRVGGARIVKWDEPFDVAYVQQEINAVTNVENGDKITYIFDQWRNSANDDVDISDFAVSYISGDILSDTTKWKIKNSILIDTKTGNALVKGKKISVDAVLSNGTSYINKKNAEQIFGDVLSVKSTIIDGKEYIALRDASTELDKNVLWTAERLVIIYDGLPTFLGFAELGEIGVALEGGDLFD